MELLPYAVRLGAHDLTAAFASIAINDRRYGPIVQTLRALEAVRSIHTDLEEASAAMEAAVEIGHRDGLEGQGGLLVEALFVHALFLYCRGVHSASKARKRMDVVGSYSADLKLAHKQITSLRDQVLAHYGRGEDQPGGPWIREHVVLHRTPFGFSFSYPNIRAATKGATNVALMALIVAASERMTRYGTEKQVHLMALLRERFSDDPQLCRLIERHSFDELTFFGRLNPPGSQSGRVQIPAGQPLVRQDDGEQR